MDSERVGANRYRHAMPYLIALRDIAHEENDHPGTEEEVDGMKESFLGIVDHSISDGLVEESDGIGGRPDAECHAERIHEDDEEVHDGDVRELLISNTPTSWCSRTTGLWRRYR